MRKEARFLIVTVLLTVLFGGSGLLYERFLQEKHEDARVIELQVIETPMDGARSRVWTWKGAAMKPILAQWKVDRTKIQAGLPDQNHWFVLVASGRKGMVWKRGFNSYHGQAILYPEITELTPQSRIYFEQLLASTKPDQK